MSENTLERPGQFDALEKARPDELIFPLLDRDPDAPPAIIFWADHRRSRIRALLMGTLAPDERDKLKDDLAQCTEAEFIAFEMQARQRGHDAEVEQARATYSGQGVARSKLDELMTKLRAQIGEADYHAHEAIESIAAIVEAGGFDKVTPEQRASLIEAADRIHRLALQLSPFRAQYLAESELPLPTAE